MKTPEEIKRDMIECMEEANWVVEVGDAHDLIDSVEKAHETMADALSFIRRLEQDNAQKDERIRQLEQRVPRWISVGERLPDHEHEVLVYTDRYGGRTEFAYYVRHLEAWYQNCCLLIPNVTHWMPLPDRQRSEKCEAYNHHLRVVPVRHGRWVHDDLGHTYCSECHERIHYIHCYRDEPNSDWDEEWDEEMPESAYCSHCGAKMDEGG